MPLDAENRAGFAPPPLLGANNMEYIPWTQGKFADRQLILRGKKTKRFRHVKKDPRVSNELAALAAGCVKAGNLEPLHDWLIEFSFIMPDGWRLTPQAAGALARWEWWPICEGDEQ